MKDLVVVSADKSIEASIKSLLQRPRDLSIRNVEFDTFTHPRRDHGCYHEGADFLRGFQRQYAHGLLIFDSAWDGAPHNVALELEARVRSKMIANALTDWGEVVVIEPEVEVWVWARSSIVDRNLGWAGRSPNLRDWLLNQGLWPEEAPKPPDPKEAFEEALKARDVAKSAAIFAKLADEVPLRRCTDPSFARFEATVRGWFPPLPGHSRSAPSIRSRRGRPR